MACRTINLKPPCGYITEGIVAVYLLDFEDFNGYKFLNDGLYTTGLVEQFLHTGVLVPLDAEGTAAKYTSTLSNGVYTHVLETFVPVLDADTLRQLDLSKTRRYVVFFQTKAGKWFTFGYENGASLSYTGQTADNAGEVVTLTTPSIYPLFEMLSTAFISRTYTPVWAPNFETGTYCRLFDETANTGFKQAIFATRQTLAGGYPLDQNDRLTIDSHQKQAILLLIGASNPDPARYEVVGEFEESDTVDGADTAILDLTMCPIGHITVTPAAIILTPSLLSTTVVVDSTYGWILTNPPQFVTISQITGATGLTTIEITATSTDGTEILEFQNIATNQIAELTVTNAADIHWVLRGNSWDNAGYWFNWGIWT